MTAAQLKGESSISYFIYADNLIGVSVNMSSFSWSYGHLDETSGKERFDACKIRVHIDIRSDGDVFDSPLSSDNMSKYHYFRGRRNESVVYYERRVLGLFWLRYALRISGNNIFAVVGQSYMRLVKRRMMTLHPMADILADFTGSLLLKNGIAPVHCAAVSNGKKTITIFSPPNTGKTMTCLRLCTLQGMAFMSEDYALTDGRNVWAVPYTESYRKYKGMEGDVLNQKRILKESKVTDVVLLEKGPKDSEQDKAKGLKRIRNLNRFEFPYRSAPALIVMDYFNEGYSLNAAERAETEILKALMVNCRFTSIAEENPIEFSSRIAELILAESPI